MVGIASSTVSNEKKTYIQFEKLCAKVIQVVLAKISLEGREVVGKPVVPELAIEEVSRVKFVFILFQDINTYNEEVNETNNEAEANLVVVLLLGSRICLHQFYVGCYLLSVPTSGERRLLK